MARITEVSFILAKNPKSSPEIQKLLVNIVLSIATMKASRKVTIGISVAGKWRCAKNLGMVRINITKAKLKKNESPIHQRRNRVKDMLNNNMFSMAFCV
jgi:hypothetical protein